MSFSCTRQRASRYKAHRNGPILTNGLKDMAVVIGNQITSNNYIKSPLPFPTPPSDRWPVLRRRRTSGDTIARIPLTPAPIVGPRCVPWGGNF